MFRTVDALGVVLPGPVPTGPDLNASLGRRGEIEGFLDLIGPVRDQTVLIVGPGALEMLCALDARGAVPVISVQAGNRSLVGTVDAIVAPNVFCLDTAEITILRALKSGRPACRLYLRFASGEGAPLVRQVRACLVRHGFGAVRSHWLGDRVVLAADRPRASSCHG